MEVIQEVLNGALLIKPKVFSDNRGYFSETFNEQSLNKIIGEVNFVQDNQSLSQKGVLRGLHFQNPPHDQGKLVRVIKGAVKDVIVDVRNSSPTYGKSFAVELSESNFLMLWVPPGFAHGFLTLENDTIFFYKVSNFYNAASEGCIKWNDNTLNINWGATDVLVSDKDQEGELFQTFNSLF